MKNLRLLLFLLPLLAACRKTETGFDMTYRRTFTIPVGLSTAQSHTYVFRDIAVDTSVFFRANGIDSVALIGEIVPKNMNIRLIFNGDGNLSFISRVEVVVLDNKLLTEYMAFYNNDLPLSSTGQVTLIPDASNVRKLFLTGDGRFALRIKLNFREIPSRSYDVEWNAVFLAKT